MAYGKETDVIAKVDALLGGVRKLHPDKMMLE